MLELVRIGLAVATNVLFLLSVIAALALRPKYLELICHFRVQYFIGAVALMVASVAFREWVGTGISLAAVLINLPVFAPGQRPRNSPEIGRRRLKLMLMNVYKGNRQYSLCVGNVRKHRPDVVVLQELNTEWAKELECLRGEYPFADAHPRDEGSGIALYSRVPFECLALTLPEGGARPGILARVSGGELTILSIHPRAPIRRGHFELRNQMLSSGAAIMREMAGPKICVGDLNTTTWSRYFKDFVEQSGMRSVREGFGILASWPTFLRPKWMMIPIDHCFVSDDIRVVSAFVGERIGSDHLPLIVELELPRERPRVSAK